MQLQTRRLTYAQTRPQYTALCYLASDALALVLAAWTGGYLWNLVNAQSQPEVFYGFWPLLFVFPLAFARVNLYAGGGLNPVMEFSRLANLTTVIYLTALLVGFLLKEADTVSRGVFLSSWSLSLILLPVGRNLLRTWFARQPWWGTPVVILGTGETAAAVCKRLLDNPEGGFKPVAFFGKQPPHTLHGIPVIGSVASATQWATAQGIGHAIVAMPEVQSERLLQIIDDYAEAFPKLIFVSHFLGKVGLSVSRRELGQLLGLQIQRNLLLPTNRFLKRALDLLIGLPLFVLALPIILLAALAIIVVSPGSPFYYQRREGFKGREIRVWKLRTMHPDADERLEHTLATNAAARAEWERFYKLKNDPRILPIVGHMLRKLSLDELPQLYNVLIGEMSLVGPRPFPYYHLEQFEPTFRKLRREVLPGITGLWQVSERSEGDLAVQEDLDSYYIRDWSLWFDIYLLARTPWAVLFGKGAY